MSTVEEKQLPEQKVPEVKSQEPLGLDEEEEQRIIKLVSSDSTEFDVFAKHCQMSVFVKSALEDDPDAEEVPVLSVKEDVLRHVVNYMNHHEGVPQELVEKPLRSKTMSEVCKDQWDAKFIDSFTDRQALYDLILAANYMDIKCLLHLGCAKVASLIKGQPLEKIKVILDPNAEQEQEQDEQKEEKSA